MFKDTVLYVGGFELPDKNAAAQRVIANGKIFRDLGYRTVFLGIDKKLSAGTDVISTETEHFGFGSWAAPYPANKIDWFRSITTAKDVETLVTGPLAGRVHAIITYNHPAISTLKIGKICRKIGAKFFSDVTEWYGFDSGSFLFRIVKGLDVTLRMRHVNFKTDGLIVTSPYLENFYQSRVKNIISLPTLFDAEYLPELIAKDRKSDALYFTYAGSSFDPNNIPKDRSVIKDRLDKVISMFQAVFTDHKNFVFNIFGLTKENYLSAFPEHEQALHEMHDHIYFHGRVPHKRVLTEIMSSDYTIFIRYLSRVIKAGFPSKLAESITYGTPAISNNYISIERYTLEGKNHFALDLDDEDARIETLRQILSAPPQAHKQMKDYCQNNRPFDYREFTDIVKDFMAVKPIS